MTTKYSSDMMNNNNELYFNNLIKILEFFK